MSSERLPVTLRDYFFHDPHFGSWDHFHAIKDQIVKVSGERLKRLDQHVRSMTGYSPMHMLETEETGHRQSKLKQIEDHVIIPFPRNWMLPSIPGLEKVHKELGLYCETGDTELVRFQEDKDGFVLTLDTHLYRPSELFLTVKDGKINISGKHLEVATDGKKESIRQFTRIYTLPAGVTEKNVVSNLSADGVLVVSAKKGGVALK